MVDALQIADVRLTPLEPHDITEAMLDIAEAWYTLTIVARNTGSTPLFVMSSVRRLQYDDVRRALVVELSEQSAVETRDAGLPFPPRVEEVAAGGEVTITYRLSSPITFVDSASSPPRPRFVHIPQDVATIDCIIAADSTSPPPNEHLASHEPLPDLRRWGHVVQRSLRVETSHSSFTKRPTAD
jgi:hypothetical protein